MDATSAEQAYELLNAIVRTVHKLEALAADERERRRLRIESLMSAANDALAELRSDGAGSDVPPTRRLFCSFCGKGNREVMKLIAGPTAFICDECIALGWQAVQEDRAERGAASPGSAAVGDYDDEQPPPSSVRRTDAPPRRE